MVRNPIAIGTEFNYWTVIGEPEYKDKIPYYPCRCRCGKEQLVRAQNLKSGESKSCGCKREMRDRTGETIGYWTLVERIGEDSYRCRCRCGTERIVKSSQLAAKCKYSCGCARKEKRNKNADEYIGRTFGSWTVLSVSEEPSSRLYLNCRCVCGKEKTILASSLISGRSTSCGCGIPKRKELIPGQQFGSWTVIELDPERTAAEKLGYYKCRCVCGKIKSVSGYSLRAGTSTSCGCKRSNKELDEMLGKQFGSWTVIELDTEREAKSRQLYYKCRCVCGTVKSVAGNSLREGKSTSCGCKRKREA